MTIGSALTAGYSIAQILGFLSGNYPNIGKKINEAKRLGYDVNKIVESFSKMNSQELENLENSGIIKGNNPWVDADEIQSKRSAYQKTKENAPKLLGAVAPLGAYIAYRALKPAIAPLVQQGYDYLMGGNDQSQTPQETPAPIQPTPEAPPPEPVQPGPNIGQQLSQDVSQPAAPGQVAQAAQAQPKSVFEQMLGGTDIASLDPKKQQELSFLSMISDQLQAKGKGLNDPEFKGIAKKVQDIIAGKPGLMVEEAARFQGLESQKQPATVENVKPAEAQQIQKGSTIITPSGDLGTIEDLPGNTAKIDIDGKKQVHKTEDLIPVPDNHEEIGDLYQKLIDKIPEGEKSRVYDAIGYDPKRNAIKYTYHDGKTYIIDDVPEEIAREIANSGFMAKTSGGNYMGFYYKGNPSIGAGMHQLISDLQKERGGKGKEYSYKFEELFSQHRTPKDILKKRFEEKNQIEREKKKREREEKKTASKKSRRKRSWKHSWEKRKSSRCMHHSRKGRFSGRASSLSIWLSLLIQR